MQLAHRYLSQGQIAFVVDDTGASLVEFVLLAALAIAVCGLGLLALKKYA